MSMLLERAPKSLMRFMRQKRWLLPTAVVVALVCAVGVAAILFDVVNVPVVFVALAMLLGTFAAAVVFLTQAARHLARKSQLRTVSTGMDTLNSVTQCLKQRHPSHCSDWDRRQPADQVVIIGQLCGALETAVQFDRRNPTRWLRNDGSTMLLLIVDDTDADIRLLYAVADVIDGELSTAQRDRMVEASRQIAA